MVIILAMKQVMAKLCFKRQSMVTLVTLKQIQMARRCTGWSSDSNMKRAMFQMVVARPLVALSIIH